MSSALFYDPNSSPVAGVVTRWNFQETFEFPQTGPNVISNPDLSQVQNLDSRWWKVENGAVVPMTDDDRNAIAAAELPAYKESKAKQIDLKTDSLLANGFIYDLTIFSLSQPAQINWTNVMMAKSLLSYPLKVSTLNNGEYSLADADAVAAFYTAGLTQAKSILDSGRALKLLVMAATTKADVDAVIDNRG